MTSARSDWKRKQARRSLDDAEYNFNQGTAAAAKYGDRRAKRTVAKQARRKAAGPKKSRSTKTAQRRTSAAVRHAAVTWF